MTNTFSNTPDYMQIANVVRIAAEDMAAGRAHSPAIAQDLADLHLRASSDTGLQDLVRALRSAAQRGDMPEAIRCCESIASRCRHLHAVAMGDAER